MNEWRVVWTNSARNYFRRALKHFQQRVRAAIVDIQTNPFTHPNVRRLHGELKGLLRYRIGNFRLVYRVLEDERESRIIALGPRGDVY